VRLRANVDSFASHRVEPVYERLALVFARVSLLLVNLRVWVGSCGATIRERGHRRGFPAIQHRYEKYSLFWIGVSRPAAALQT
jgi:hypothetical protein